MKYLQSFLILISFSLFVSCSNDSEEIAEDDASVVVGNYGLTEVNISIPQDPNNDGTTSTNIVTELDCITGTINILENGTWSASVTNVSISPVTGDFYAVRCDGSSTFAGNWSFQNGVLNLNSAVFSNMTLSDSVLTENINEELPGILSRKYVRP